MVIIQVSKGFKWKDLVTWLKGYLKGVEYMSLEIAKAVRNRGKENAKVAIERAAVSRAHNAANLAEGVNLLKQVFSYIGKFIKGDEANGGGD